MTRTSWTPLQTYNTTQDRRKHWTVKRNDESGQLGCDCPAWRFSGTKRDCKHVRHFSANLLPTLRERFRGRIVDISPIPKVTVDEVVGFFPRVITLD
jgi:hypothetical protein